jgi:short-subunit dehydrogenase
MPSPETSTKLAEYFSRFSVIVITGGSSGIGCSIIKAILKIRPEIHLCNLSRSEPDIFLGTNGAHFGVDLSDASALHATSKLVLDRINQSPAGELLLINNSGFGDYGRFPQLDGSKQLKMIDLNIRAVVDLTARLLPVMLQRRGQIVNIASTAAFQPTPFLATYGATKSFVRNWSLALNEDLRGSGVQALALCPGPTQSNFFKAAGFSAPPIGNSGGVLDMTADQVAEQTIEAIAKRKALRITGWRNALVAFFGSKAPIVAVTRIGAIILRKMRLEAHR